MEKIATGDNDIQELEVMLNESLEKFGNKNRFIHPKSVRNFIFHYNIIRDKSRKKLIHESLFQYLTLLMEIEIHELSPQISANLFRQFLTPVLPYYEVRLGFSMHIKNIVFGFILFIVFAIYFTIDLPAYFLIGIISIIGLAFFHNRYKDSLHKTYGIYY